MNLKKALCFTILLFCMPLHAASTWRPLTDTRPNNAVWMASASTGWAVGDVGLIHQTTDGGVTWVAQTSGTTVNLNSVWGTDASTVWAVGDQGTILLWNGSNWASQTSGVTTNLQGVHGVNASTAWAVGLNKTILKWNGTVWTPQNGPTGNWGLNAVFTFNATNIWAVGPNGRIVKSDGTNWANQTSGTTDDLYSVWASSATNILAVGQNGTVRFCNNGTTWATGPASGVTTILRGITGTDATHVWTCGDAGVMRFYNGTGSFSAQTSSTGQALNGIVALSATNLIAVGARTTFDHSTDGTTWTDQTAATPAINFSGIWGSDDNNVWFAGPGGTMMRYNGAIFSTPASTTTQALNDVHGADANNIWAVGAAGTIIHWNGSAWAAQTSGTTQTLNGVFATSATDVWAVGNAGTLLHYNGSVWATQTSNVTVNLNALWAADANNIWIVGDAGTILRPVAGLWKVQASGTTKALTEVVGTSSTSIWAVGGSGTLLKSSGSTWAAQASGTTTGLTSLAVVNTTNQWAAGGSAIRKGTGSTWAADGSTGYPNAINAAFATSANTVFLAAATGMIFVNSPATVPEIAIEQPTGTPLASGKNTIDFGTLAVPATLTKTFTLRSTGSQNLLTQSITLAGTGATSFSIANSSSYTAMTTPIGTSITFDVTFTPTSDGAKTCILTIANNDLDEPLFTISLTGLGQVPVIYTTQPISKAVNPNAAAIFTAAVSATATKTVTYKWQKYNTVSLLWGDIGGATAASYSIAHVAETDQGDYRLLATNPVSTVISNSVTLSVNDPILITTPPLPKTLAMNDSITLSVIATGSDAKKYQWRKSGANISGATTDSYPINSAQLAQAGDYSVVVSNMVNTQISTIATVSVIDATAKTLKLPTLGKAIITASYTGKPTSFLWKKDGNALPADFRYTFVKNVLTIATLQVGPITDAAVYTCDITGPDASTVISTTTLIVYSAAPEILGADPLTMPDAMVGDPTYSYQIPVDSDALKAPTSFIASGLPTGLKCNPTTGLITGKPSVALSSNKPYLVTLTAANAKGKSTKKANLLLKALPAPSIGTFTGPIVREPTLNKNLGGRFDLITTSTGAFTGKVTLGILAYSIKGILSSDVTGSTAPTATVTIPRKLPLLNLTVSFTMDLANHTLTACDVTDGTLHASFTAWRKKWGTAMPLVESDDLKSYLGYYTFGMDPPVPSVLAPITPAEVLPQGMGYGSFSVATTGLLKIVGKLADGTVITSSSFCGPHGEVMLYQALYANLGSVLGTLDITQGTPGFAPAYGDNTLGGTVSWLRPANLATTNHLYRAGFAPTNLTAVGGRYVAPVSPGLLFGVTDNGIDTNAHLVFTDGGLTGTSTDLVGTQTVPNVNARIKLAGLVAVPPHSAVILPDPNPRSTTLTITQSTGLFTGKATLLDTNPAVVGTNITRSLSYYGIIFRDAGTLRGYGYFLLPRRPNLTTQTVLTTDQLSGQVVLEKSP